MDLGQAARRTFLAVLVLALGGCGATRIGTPGTALMGPDEGLVVGSVAYVIPHPGMEYRFFIHAATYESTDGQAKKEFALGTISDVQQHLIRTPRNPNETFPVLMMIPAKAGKYRLKSSKFIAEGQAFTFSPENSKEFEVVPGQITYVGSTVASYEARFRGVGVLTPISIRPGTRNDFVLDIAELKTVEKRLESITASNALTQ